MSSALSEQREHASSIHYSTNNIDDNDYNDSVNDGANSNQFDQQLHHHRLDDDCDDDGPCSFGTSTAAVAACSDVDSDAEEEIDCYDESASSTASGALMSPNNNRSKNRNKGNGPGGGGGGGNNRKSGGKRFRTQMTTTMIKVMKSIFADYKTPTMAECQSLGKELGLSKRVVQVWFQNARAKDKKARAGLAKWQQQSSLGGANQQQSDHCSVCNIKYQPNPQLSSSSTPMQDHLFSKIHIERLKMHLNSAQQQPNLDDDNSADYPIASAINLFPNTATTFVPPSLSIDPDHNDHHQQDDDNDNDSTTVDKQQAAAATKFLQQLQMIQNLASIQNSSASTDGQSALNLADLIQQRQMANLSG